MEEKLIILNNFSFINGQILTFPNNRALEYVPFGLFTGISSNIGFSLDSYQDKDI